MSIYCDWYRTADLTPPNPCEGSVELQLPLPPVWPVAPMMCDKHWTMALELFEMDNNIHVSQVPGYIEDSPGRLVPRHRQLPDGRIVPIEDTP